MSESRDINRKVNRIFENLEAMTLGDRIKIIQRDDYTFMAAALTSNVANQVILSPTSTLVQIVVKSHSVNVVANAGIIDLESSSTSVGVGGVFCRMYATRYQSDHHPAANVPLGIGADLRVTSTVGDAAFISINYIEST